MKAKEKKCDNFLDKKLLTSSQPASNDAHVLENMRQLANEPQNADDFDAIEKAIIMNMLNGTLQPSGIRSLIDEMETEK